MDNALFHSEHKSSFDLTIYLQQIDLVTTKSGESDEAYRCQSNDQT